MKKIFLFLIPFMAMTFFATAQDRDRDQTRDQDQDQLQQRDRIHQEDHLMLLDGQLYQMKNGVRSRVQEQVKLNNGTVISPNGSYELQNHERYQLRNNECMDMNGNRYLNQNKFNKRQMMTNKQIERAQDRIMNKSTNRNKNNTGNQPGNRGNNN